MTPAIKLCGLTRPADAAEAAGVGADYVGVIFAGGPRTLSPARAVEVLAPTRGRATAIGVFGHDTAETIARVARAAALDGVQLHADPTVADIAAVRRAFDGIIWAAYRVRGASLGDEAAALFDAADAVVLDARVDEALGGTGTTLPWQELAEDVRRLGARRAALVLAGGLRAGNVEAAVRAMAPQVVDVSSGVESSPGIKDHAQMRAFVDAARAAAPAPRGS